MTSVIAHRVAPSGSVYSFEPHPALYSILAENVRRWRTSCDVSLYPLPFAVHHRKGYAFLSWDSSFQHNQGTASLAREAPERTRVPCTTLDSLFPSAHLHILKIDVEGNEQRVIEGANSLLWEQRVDHILYECHDGPRALIHDDLRKRGYTAFSIGTSLRGPTLFPINDFSSATFEKSSTYLATRFPSPTKKMVAPYGWKCLTEID